MAQQVAPLKLYNTFLTMFFYFIIKRLCSVVDWTLDFYARGPGFKTRLSHYFPIFLLKFFKSGTTKVICFYDFGATCQALSHPKFEIFMPRAFIICGQSLWELKFQKITFQGTVAYVPSRHQQAASKQASAGKISFYCIGYLVQFS